MHRLLIVLFLLASFLGCSGTTGKHGRTLLPWTGDLEHAPVVLLVGVVDLRASDLDSGALPRLRTLLRDATRYTDVIAEGSGASAASAFVSGRSPLDELRRPIEPLQWARDEGWATTILHVSGTLASEPELGRWSAFANAPGIEPFPTPAFGSDRTLAVSLLDPFSRTRISSSSTGTDDREAALRTFDLAVSAWIESLREDYGDRLHVWITGIPRAPDPRSRASVGGSPMERIDRHRVPLWRLDPGGRRDPITTPSTPRSVMARLRNLPLEDTATRCALWWNEFGGGALVTRGEQIAILDDRGRVFLYDTSHEPIDRVDLASSEPDTVTALTDELARRTIGGVPRAWAAVRGSAAIDFVGLKIIAAGEALRWEPWGLEAIDSVDTLHAASVELTLAAEPQADGVLVDLGWPPRTVEFRLTGWMEDVPLLGNPVDLGAGRERFHGVRFARWSRPFWEATGNPWPVAADAWWPTAAPGLHVRIAPESETAPVPAPLDL